ncbi:MAG TPA: tetratricopeptide repeat protein, partial [Herpetosiphonaceae bacterium]
MPESFGQQLKAYRTALDQTQAALAERVGCAVESIRKMEANKQRPSRAFAARLAEMLAVPDGERERFIALARAVAPGQGDRHAAAAAPLAGTPSAATPPEATWPAVSWAPLPATPLVGRADETARVCELLRAPATRLLTITGPGGMGKTRLALHVAELLRGEFADGAAFAALDRLAAPEQLCGALAEALGLPAGGRGPALRHISLRLRSARLLLVLDNVEQLQPAAALLGELLAGAPGLQILATSRVRLRLAAEQLFPLPPLALPAADAPADPAALLAYDAIQLFDQRARAFAPGFAVDGSNAAAVAALCRQLEGLPLAIELAAARLRLLSPALMLDYMRQRFELLAGGPQDAPPRHQTLRNAIAWSYDLLGAAEQDLFRRLAVFAGGWSLAAAEAVCPGPLIEPLATLVDHSLVQPVAGAPGRFAMLESIREYALEQLSPSGSPSAEEDAARRRHLAWCLALAEREGPELTGSDEGASLARLALERENLRAAVGWALAQGEQRAAISLLAGLPMFWYVAGDPAELNRWLTGLIGAEEPAAVRAEALGMLGYVRAFMRSDYAAGLESYREAVALWRAQDERQLLTNGLARLGEIAMEQGAYDEAHGWYGEALELRRLLGDTEGVVGLRDCIGQVLVRQGRFAAARAVFEETLGWWERRGYPRAIAFSHNSLGMIALYEGRFADARRHHERALAIWRATGDTRGVSSALNALGPALLALGEWRRARDCLAESLRLRWSFHDYDGIAWNLERLAEVAAAAGEAGRAAGLWARADRLREEL